jgi:hypothetical protein
MAGAWTPRTEADIQGAIDGGLVRETHTFDAKREQPPPTGKNEDVAVDLASLAVDGGRILYGLHDPKPPTASMVRAPFDILGLPERIDQIAGGGLIDPPLRVTCHPIPSDEHTERGYLLVEIPVSPDAPHQVGGKYRGRGDTTNIVLSDREVRRLHDERSRRNVDLGALLDAEIARDPTGLDLRSRGHLFVVAQSLVPRDDLLSRAFTSAQEWRQWLGSPFQHRLREARTENASPRLTIGTSLSPRPDGWAIHTHEMGDDRHLRRDLSSIREDRLLDLEIRDDGGLRLFCGRATWIVDRNPPVPVVFHELIVTLTYLVVTAALAVAEQSGYQGEWGFGAAINGIGDAIVGDNGYFEDRRIVDDYVQVASVSGAEVEADPSAVVARLLGRFYRGIGMADGIPGL